MQWILAQRFNIISLSGSALQMLSFVILQIHGNPFRCDCRLLEFAHWVQESSVPRTLEPSCKKPQRLANRTVVSVELEELACLPQVEPSTNISPSNYVHGIERKSIQDSVLPSAPDDTYAKTETKPAAGRKDNGGASVVGSNVSLRCSVFGLPSAVVSWWSNQRVPLTDTETAIFTRRLVANGTRLLQSWEDQYYAINEYRTNAHQVNEYDFSFILPISFSKW